MTKDDLIQEIDNKINKLTGWKWDFGITEKERLDKTLEITDNLIVLLWNLGDFVDNEKRLSTKS